MTGSHVIQGGRRLMRGAVKRVAPRREPRVRGAARGLVLAVPIGLLLWGLVIAAF